jgi:hypothetical protein
MLWHNAYLSTRVALHFNLLSLLIVALQMSTPHVYDFLSHFLLNFLMCGNM